MYTTRLSLFNRFFFLQIVFVFSITRIARRQKAVDDRDANFLNGLWLQKEIIAWIIETLCMWCVSWRWKRTNLSQSAHEILMKAIPYSRRRRIQFHFASIITLIIASDRMACLPLYVPYTLHTTYGIYQYTLNEYITRICSSFAKSLINSSHYLSGMVSVPYYINIINDNDDDRLRCVAVRSSWWLRYMIQSFIFFPRQTPPRSRHCICCCSDLIPRIRVILSLAGVIRPLLFLDYI